MSAHLAVYPHPLYARYPALARAAAYGVAVQLPGGVVARVQPVIVGELVRVPTIIETPAGPIRVIAETHVETFARLVDAAERNGTIPRLAALFEQHTGRPLLPRGW